MSWNKSLANGYSKGMACCFMVTLTQEKLFRQAAPTLQLNSVPCAAATCQYMYVKLAASLQGSLLQCQAVAERRGLSHRRYTTAAELQAAYPMNAKEGYEGLFENGAGTIKASRCVPGIMQSATLTYFSHTLKPSHPLGKVVHACHVRGNWLTDKASACLQ